MDMLDLLFLDRWTGRGRGTPNVPVAGFRYGGRGCGGPAAFVDGLQYDSAPSFGHGL